MDSFISDLNQWNEVTRGTDMFYPQVLVMRYIFCIMRKAQIFYLQMRAFIWLGIGEIQMAKTSLKENVYLKNPQ